jgi:putative endonuclease
MTARPDKPIRGTVAEARGRAAEALAEAALAAEGFSVLDRRCRTPAGEIDLVVTSDGLLVFVEVKARPSLSEAAFALTPRQQARLLAAGEWWLGMNPERGSAGVRFDVLWLGARVWTVFGGVVSLSETMDHPIVRKPRIHGHETQYSSFPCFIGVFGFC